MAKNKNFQQAKNAISKKDKDNESKSKSQVTNPLAIALIALIAVALVATLNPASGAQQQEGIVVGTYSGDSIVYTDGSEYDNIAKQTYASFMQRIDSSQQQQFASFYIEFAYRNAFTSMVMNKVYENLAAENNIIASEYRIKEEIKDEPRFQIDGTFSAAEYNSTDQQTLLDYFDFIAANYEVGTITDVLYRSNAVNPALVDLIENQSKEQRRIEWVVYDDSDFPEDSLTAFAQENLDLFRSVDLSRITVLDRAKAEEVLAQIQQGDLRFAEIATANSQDTFAASGGALGLKYVNEIQGEFENKEDLEALLALSQGEVSPIFETFSGYTIYRLESEVQSMDLSNPESLTRVKNYIRTQEAGLYSDSLLALAEEKRDSGIWTSAALDKDIKTSDFFAINVEGFENIDGLASAGDPVLTGLQTPEFYSLVFEAEIGDIIDPITTNNNTILLARVIEERTLEEVDKEADINQSIFTGREASFQNQIMASDEVEDQFDEVWPQLSARLFRSPN